MLLLTSERTVLHNETMGLRNEKKIFMILVLFVMIGTGHKVSFYCSHGVHVTTSSVPFRSQ